ncbi:MAG: hypothetical protein AAGD96_16380 [Chloroflexota bacterium]
MSHYDVIVVGRGLIGSATARHLAHQADTARGSAVQLKQKNRE